MTALVVSGALIGLVLDWAVAVLLSAAIAQSTGIAMQAVVGWRELGLTGAVIVLCLVLATIPALLIYRRPVIEGLR